MSALRMLRCDSALAPLAPTAGPLSRAAGRVGLRSGRALADPLAARASLRGGSASSGGWSPRRRSPGCFGAFLCPLLPATLAEPLARIGMVTPAPAPARAVAVRRSKSRARQARGHGEARRQPRHRGPHGSQRGTRVAEVRGGRPRCALDAGRSPRSPWPRYRSCGSVGVARPRHARRGPDAARRSRTPLDDSGLSRPATPAQSAEVTSPLVLGLLDARIVLPAAPLPSADELELALAHELLHLRQRDLLWGLVPAAAERLFFFHPLVRLAAREYTLAVESACDREVL